MSGNGNSGRRPKPVALKLYEGNRGGRRLPEEPAFRPGLADCPPEMPKDGQEMWKRLLSWLGYIPGLLQEPDWLVMKLASESFAEYEELGRFLAQSGRSYRGYFVDPSGSEHENWKPRPEVMMRERARKALDGYLSRLGISPADRSRLKAPGGVWDGSLLDDDENLLDVNPRAGRLNR